MSSRMRGKRPRRIRSSCLGSANMSDSFAADIDQVLCGQPAHGLIVNPDEVRREARQDSVDQDVGSLLPLDSKEEIHCRAARRDDQNIEPPRQELIDLLLFHVRIFLRRGDDQIVPALSQSLG